MNKFARIQDGFVAEVIATEGDIGELFNPALVWTKIPDELPVAENWRYQDGIFEKPPAAAAPAAPVLSDLQAQLNALAARISAFVSHS